MLRIALGGSARVLGTATATAPALCVKALSTCSSSSSSSSAALRPSPSPSCARSPAVSLRLSLAARGGSSCSPWVAVAVAASPAAAAAPPNLISTTTSIRYSSSSSTQPAPLKGKDRPRMINSSPSPSDNKGEQADRVPQPGPEREDEKKPIPETGWEGETPSHKGGDYEEDFLNKPPYRWSSDKFVKKYESRCWCGNLVFEFAGDPWDAKFCHCHDCQRLHGAPFQHAVIFPKTSVRMVKCENSGGKGDSAVDFFSTEKKTSVHFVPCKVACENCRAPLFDEGRNTVLCYPSSFDFGPDRPMPDDFKAKCHIFYGSRSVDMVDGLPKWAGHKGHSKLLPEVAQTDEEKKKLRQPKF